MSAIVSYALVRAPYDAPMRGFLVAMWVIAFVTLFGPESRFFIVESQSIVIPTITLLLFLLSPLALREVFLRRALSLGGSKRLNAADPKVVAWVTDRARALGINRQLEVLTIPNFDAINGHTVELRDKGVIALTIKAQLLLLSQDPENVAAFRVLVDHELGHLVNKDVGLLFLARSVLAVSVALVLFKLIMDAWIGPEQMLEFYSYILPTPMTLVLGVAYLGLADNSCGPLLSPVQPSEGSLSTGCQVSKRVVNPLCSPPFLLVDIPIPRRWMSFFLVHPLPYLGLRPRRYPVEQHFFE